MITAASRRVSSWGAISSFNQNSISPKEKKKKKGQNKQTKKSNTKLSTAPLDDFQKDALPSLFLVVFRHKTRVTPSQNQLYWATRPDNAGHALQGIILEIKSSSFPNITSGSEREGESSSGGEKSKSPQSRRQRIRLLRRRERVGFWIYGAGQSSLWCPLSGGSG